MKKAHFSDSQILAILKQAENGVPTPELHGYLTCLGIDSRLSTESDKFSIAA